MVKYAKYVGTMIGPKSHIHRWTAPRKFIQGTQKIMNRTSLGRSLYVSRILGPITRFRIAEILLQMKLASRASRPRLTVGFLRILCSGLCTVQRLHVEGDAQMCRMGLPDEPESLSHYNECHLPYNFLPQYGDRLQHYHGEAIFSMS